MPNANPVASALAEEAIRALAVALPRIVQAPDDLDARAAALRGASLAGLSLAAVGTGLRRKLAHVLGGAFDLPHAEVLAVLWPYTTAFHASSHRAAMDRITRALQGDDAPGGLRDLGHALGLAPDLAALGLGLGARCPDGPHRRRERAMGRGTGTSAARSGLDRRSADI